MVYLTCTSDATRGLWPHAASPRTRATIAAPWPVDHQVRPGTVGREAELRRGERLIGWQRASDQPLTVDLMWLLQSFALVVTASKPTVIAECREQLVARHVARFDEST